MSVIRRWEAQPWADGGAVLDVTSPNYAVRRATCARLLDAKEIADALNNHQGAVSTLGEVERILRALDAQYVAMKYLPTTEPRAQVLEALAAIGGQ